MPRAERSPSRLRQLTDAVTAAVALDPESVRRRLARASEERWWLRPIAYVGVALLGLVGAVATLLRNWRLVLLEITPAVWVGAITWQWRQIVLHGDDLPVLEGWSAVAAAALVAVATAVSYWCNVTFAFTVGQPPPLSIPDAFRAARARAGWIWLASAATATIHIAVVTLVVRTERTWFALALAAVAALQMYALVAVPVAIVGARPTRPQSASERARAVTASLGVSGITATPGLALNRLGVLLIGLGWLRWIGVAIVAVGTLVQVAGVSSATAVKLAARLGVSTDSTSGSAPPTQDRV